MAKYEQGDIATFWFVVYTDPNNGTKIIKGYSDNKALIKAYIDFHKCPDFVVKGKTDTIDNLVKVMNANANDEIQVVNIYTRDPKAKKGRNKLKIVAVPMTLTEKMFLDDDTTGYLNSEIDYAYINSALPYLKNKYQEILEDILLTDIIQQVNHNHTTKKISYIDIDQLLLLLKIPGANFGL